MRYVQVCPTYNERLGIGYQCNRVKQLVKIKEPDAIKRLIMSDDYEHKRIISISAHQVDPKQSLWH